MSQGEGHRCTEGCSWGSCVPCFRGRRNAKISLRGWKGSKVPRQISVHRSGLGIKGPSQGQAGRGVGGKQCMGRDQEMVDSTQCLTLAVSLPDHDVALITLTAVGALCVGASSPMAHLWLLTLVYVYKHMEKT